MYLTAIASAITVVVSVIVWNSEIETIEEITRINTSLIYSSRVVDVTRSSLFHL
jgi:hypothetical protein